jgi:hypothetical protein
MGGTGLGRAFLGALVVTGALASSFSCKSSDASQVTNLAPQGDIDDELMHTTNDLPILVAVPNGGSAMALVYNAAISDPITDWGGCLELVRRCYYSVPRGQRIGGCVGAIKRCSSTDATKGGPDCCPAQCIDDYKVAAQAAADDVAVDTTILRGDCVAGYTAFVGAGH